MNVITPKLGYKNSRIKDNISLRMTLKVQVFTQMWHLFQKPRGIYILMGRHLQNLRVYHFIRIGRGRKKNNNEMRRLKEIVGTYVNSFLYSYVYTIHMLDDATACGSNVFSDEERRRQFEWRFTASIKYPCLGVIIDFLFLDISVFQLKPSGCVFRCQLSFRVVVFDFLSIGLNKKSNPISCLRVIYYLWNPLIPCFLVTYIYI